MSATFWTALTAIGALATTMIAFVDQMKRNKLHKREMTIRALVELENAAIDNLYQFKTKTIEQISHDPQCAEYKCITHLMDLMQIFAIGLEEKVYDETIVYRTEISKLARIYVNIEPMIAKKRSISGLNDYSALEMFGNKIKNKYPNIR